MVFYDSYAQFSRCCFAFNLFHGSLLLAIIDLIFRGVCLEMQRLDLLHTTNQEGEFLVFHAHHAN